MSVPAIDATPGGASANSYADLTEANEYFEIHPEAQVWDRLDVHERRKVLLFGTILIDREDFWGRKNSPNQALEFPRSSDSTVPLDVRHALFEQCLDLAKGTYLKRLRQDEMQEQGVRQVTTSDTQVRTTVFRPNLSVYKLCTTARTLLLRFIDSSVIIGRG